jgi:hypothetical protein
MDDDGEDPYGDPYANEAEDAASDSDGSLDSAEEAALYNEVSPQACYVTSVQKLNFAPLWALLHTLLASSTARSLPERSECWLKRVIGCPLHFQCAFSCQGRGGGVQGRMLLTNSRELHV